jgi:nitrate/nitrite transporter NarK
VAPHSARALGLTPNGLQIWLGIAGIGCCVAMAMPQVHIVAYCVDLGYGTARGAEMLSIMTLCGIASRLGSGWIADRIGGLKTLLLGSTAQAVACSATWSPTGWSGSTSSRRCSACSRAASSRATA